MFEFLLTFLFPSTGAFSLFYLFHLLERKGGREDRGGGGDENIEGLRD